MTFNIIIDKKVVSVNANMTILQACESANIIVPKFCYHERLSIAGNCRMCLVEIDKAPKLVASCAMPVMQNMVIRTNSLAVKKAREGVLEFLLINHPLDCGICDQAGECDLQEQSKGFGSDRGRFQENKRAVQDFECGPLIKTIMTRCIHCTRCVRFANEIIGLPDLGTSGRGGALEINLYIKKLFKSEFSGNLIDLCPVGALTSKPYTFMARSWELKSIESIDVLDGIGSNIRLDTRGYELMRILPRLNENINEEWISDKTRFAFDGLRQQRLYEPLLKNLNNQFEVITWKQALTIVIQQLYKINLPYKFGAVVGSQADFDSVSLLNLLVKRFNGRFLEFYNTNLRSIDFKFSYLFNSNIKNLENSDICILLGVNPRIEGAILNLRLRKRYLAGNFKVASFGSFFDVSFPVYNLGSTFSTFLKFIEGRHSFSKYFAKARKPIVIIGQAFFETIGEEQSLVIFKLLAKNTTLLNKKWCGINILNNNASDVGKYEIGVKTYSPLNYNLDLLYIVGEGKFKNLDVSTFVIYQGYQANNTTQKANLILPGKSFIEKISGFVNIEGRYQLTKTAISSPASSKDDWAILYAILEKTNLVSFIKTYGSPYYKKPSLIAMETFLQKIEMDPFYGISKEDPSIIELNLNNYNLASVVINSLNELNYYFFFQEYLKVIGQIPNLRPDVFQLYCAVVRMVYLMFNLNLSFFSYGLLFVDCVQQTMLYYESVGMLESGSLRVLKGFLKRLETIILTSQIDEFDSIKDMRTNELVAHFFCIWGFSSSLTTVKYAAALFEDCDLVNESLYSNFKFFFEYINETEVNFVQKAKFFINLSELIRLFYAFNFYNSKKMHIEFIYCIFRFYKKKFFDNNYVNRYKKVFAFENCNEKQFSVFFFKVKNILNYCDKDDFYYFSFSFDKNIWAKITMSHGFLNVNDIRVLHIPKEKYNNLTYQYLNFKNTYFLKNLDKITLLHNIILPSSKLDNFYLMNDFTKLSLLMKHCSDAFLERSPFKK